MEEETRDIPHNAVENECAEAGGLGTEISFLFAKTGLDSEIPELRGYEITPAPLKA
ncbi:MAG TPA: hypothetical protein VF283_03115 [Bryobacteraceae bacterium]